MWRKFTLGESRRVSNRWFGFWRQTFPPSNFATIAFFNLKQKTVLIYHFPFPRIEGICLQWRLSGSNVAWLIADTPTICSDAIQCNKKCSKHRLPPCFLWHTIRSVRGFCDKFSAQTSHVLLRRKWNFLNYRTRLCFNIVWQQKYANLPHLPIKYFPWEFLGISVYKNTTNRIVK